MHDSAYTQVCNTLAHYLEIAPSQIKPEHELRGYWGLDSVELSTIAASLEEQEEIEIRTEDLALVTTVAQLVRLVRALRARSAYEVHLLAANDSSLTNRRRQPSHPRR
jgi:acyl carrier protein